MYNPPKLQIPAPTPMLELSFGTSIPFSGLNLRDAEMKIGNGQSPSMQNINLDDGGAITKRRGQVYVLAESLGPGKINGMHEDLFYGKIVYAHGTKLYTYDETTETNTEIATGLTNAKGGFFTFNDVLYYKNGTDYKAITSAFSVGNITGYIPTLTIGRAPTGGGTAYEQFNLIQPGFKDSFSGTVGTTAYTLSLSGLDATAVTAVVNGVAKAETTDFTVNRTTGVVTFSVAPGAGTNNVIITAYKTVSGFAERIKGCLYSDLFGGGSQDSRIFTAGNDNYKNAYWYTGLTGNTAYDATYWPENNFNRIGSDTKKIVGWTKLYSRLLPMKEDGIYSITYSTGTVTFPVSVLNSQVGCDMPGSIQIVKNLPVYGNTKSGLWIITSTLIESEKNVNQISALINGVKNLRPGLLDESMTDLANCSSFDDGRKYYICVGSKAWVWDYELSPYNGSQEQVVWFYYTNINAENWAYMNRETYYGDRTIGQIVKFQDNYNDFGQPIDAFWKSKALDFGTPNWKKTIQGFSFSTRSGTNTNITFTLTDDRNQKTKTVLIKSKSFSWASSSFWSAFTWKVFQFQTTKKINSTHSGTINFQLKAANNELNKNLSIMSIILLYTKDQMVR
ncbi:MAG: hypothetical protein Q8873_00520 [Bacillota bacterium]|nr:hypothetical protein [Bacillota bacterium]